MIYKKEIMRMQPLYKDETMHFLNLGVIYCYWSSKRVGWFRLFGSWYGIHWKPKDAYMLFSERNGHTKTWVIGNYRFKILKPYKI